MTSDASDPKRTLEVPVESNGRPLLEFLSARLIGHSKTRLRRLIGEGRIRVNGGCAVPKRRLREGDLVGLPDGLERGELPKQHLELNILHEDPSLLCVDKPAGRSVLPARGGQGKEFYQSLVAYVNRDAPDGGPYLRPHVVHRLDRQTSGVLLVAKNAETGRRLSRQFETRRVEKGYVVLCEGALPRHEIHCRAPIARRPGTVSEMRAVRDGGKVAHSVFRARRRFGHFTLVGVELHTGRQHQIRVHLQAIGYPPAVDPLYGRRDRLTGGDLNSVLGREAVPAGRLLLDRCPLHAERIAYAHPVTGEPMEHRSDLPRDVADVAALLAELDPPA